MQLLKLAPFVALAAAHPSILTERDGAAPAADPTFKKVDLLAGKLSLGIALPKAASDNGDFIGQLKGTGIGWGGISLGPSMTKFILIVAEPSGSSVTGSLHKTNSRSYPPPFSDPSVSLKTIAGSTTAASGSWTYTFLCSGCLKTGLANFTSSADAGSIAYAYHASSPKLSYHTGYAYTTLTGLSAGRSDGYAAAARSARK